MLQMNASLSAQSYRRAGEVQTYGAQRGLQSLAQPASGRTTARPAAVGISPYEPVLPSAESLNNASETLAKMRIQYPDAQGNYSYGNGFDRLTGNQPVNESAKKSVNESVNESVNDLWSDFENGFTENSGEMDDDGVLLGKAALAGAEQFSGKTPIAVSEDDAGRKLLGVGEKAASSKVEKAECQTCARRKYQDGSDDPGVSFKTATALSPDEAATAVRGHEQEHVVREQAAAAREGRKVVSQSVTIHTDICPECGRVYVSGGETRTVTMNDNSNEDNLNAVNSLTGENVA